MPTGQTPIPQRKSSSLAASPRSPMGPSRFARAARDPRWTAAESTKARAGLVRQAARVRRQLAERRANQALEPTEPPTPAPAKGRRRMAAWLLPPLVILTALALLGSAPPVSSQTRNAPSRASVDQLQHLIDAAREAGLSEDQIRQITIEDEFGTVINAWDYLQDMEKRKQMELAKRQEEQNRVYLTPQDIFRELRRNEREDLDRLRDRLPFDRERYR